MYYDLVCSLPHLPYFEEADRLPITPLRLNQRMKRLGNDHADQLRAARPLVQWSAERFKDQTDLSLDANYRRFQQTAPSPLLHEYVTFRLTQRLLLAALRMRPLGKKPSADYRRWGLGSQVASIHQHWDAPYFQLEYRFTWLPDASERLAAGDAVGLERILMGTCWRWLTRVSESSMFSFESVMAFLFKWDMLRAWLAFDSPKAKIQFSALIDKVTHVANS
ncbi:DUF2764 family protein [Rhodopirellula sallentina]|uniref:V-type ATP synthase subunit A-like protein n=1 Tax=Rhodopirellula sallentina SM41 TaxID=1263870 RepID=M5U3Z8_9BACT|nr:DUF2764 family protein [Rhodopirellula sallentina]EMI52591.1 V-type ATP synthase subunit A-like protein [Rhodopirellula sallentina SM41]